MFGLIFTPIGREVKFDRPWWTVPDLGNYSYYGRPQTPPKFKIGLWGRQPAIIRIEDSKVVARWHKSEIRTYVLATLAFWNQGHYPEVAKYQVVKGMSMTKQARLEAIRAICINKRNAIHVNKAPVFKFLPTMNDEEFRLYYNTLLSWDSDYWTRKAKIALRRRLRERHGEKFNSKNSKMFRNPGI